MPIKDVVKGWRDSDSLYKNWAWIFALYLYRDGVAGVFGFIRALFPSYFLSFKMFGFGLVPRVAFSHGHFKVNFKACSSSRMISRSSGVAIIFERWRSGAETNIVLGKCSEFIIDNTFVLGDGCKIQVENSGKLFFGGKSKAQSSGITCDTIILCSENISIGSGSIISWGCYISDSSQHKINGVLKIDVVHIGKDVWISEGVTCGPGCNIGDGSIVGSKSYVAKSFPSAVIIAGSPARVVKENVSWSR